jgi:ERF superfamily
VTDALLPLEMPTRSESIAALGAALAKAQGEMAAAAKANLNPHFQSRYADLASIWDACRVPLSKNGLAVLQPVSAEGARVSVRTLLVHASGEWIGETLTITALQNTPQGIGSAVTYARRYALAAMIGVAPDDDDGNAATRPAFDTRTGEIHEPSPKAEPDARTITDGQRKRLFATAKEKGWSKELIQDALKTKFNLDSTKAITRAQYDDVVSAFEEAPPIDPDTPF